MHCFYCKLTSLISQAILQAVLDKVTAIFFSRLLHREISKVTSHEAIAQQPPEEAASIDDNMTGGTKEESAPRSNQD
jgi:hypothetical protein